jgi:glycosyltransferase involved in cell wall biosynthesis
MKIAFDGTVLHGHKSGVGYYCEELLKAMLRMNHKDEFLVFSHLPVKVQFPSANGNLTFSNTVSCRLRAFYLHALLPGILDTAQPDLCHYTNFLAPVSEKRPYVVTIHDMGLEVLRDSHPLAKRLYTKRLVPHVARKARFIITNSEHSKWEIVRYLGIAENRIRVTPLAASLEFTPVAVNPTTPYFLYVGNLEPRKNLVRLIQAYAGLPRKDHDLVIVGARWYRGSAAEDAVRGLGLSAKVRFLGYVDRKELPALFSGATAVVYPSLLEGFGLPVLEAMACGAPVITSNNSALREVAGDAAVLVNPLNVRELTEAMAQFAEDEPLRREFSLRGLSRAAEFSWDTTARLTLQVYEEAISGAPAAQHGLATRLNPNLQPAIQKTLDYANMFQYPLTAEEVRERLFGVEIDASAFNCAISGMRIPADEQAFRVRALREQISDEAIHNAQSHLRTLACMPFVRMIAFSGATAHRNMSDAEDLDLFMVVEDGKLWAAFLICIVWAKLKGLRKRLCMNYLISDAALPLFEHDVFTAQQVASLKPIYGKDVYDRFILMNPFVRRCFPNFQPLRHRESYPEIKTAAGTTILEGVLRCGPIQILERISRSVLGRYLRRKAQDAARSGTSDVLLDARRLKLHLKSHKRAVLDGCGNPLHSRGGEAAPLIKIPVP